MLGHAFFPTKKTKTNKQTNKLKRTKTEQQRCQEGHRAESLQRSFNPIFHEAIFNKTILPKFKILTNLRRLPSKWPNFGSGGPFEIFKKRKMIRIEFLKDLARLQTPQSSVRGSKTPTRPRNIDKSKNRSFFERFQGPPWAPWSLLKVTTC